MLEVASHLWHNNQVVLDPSAFSKKNSIVPTIDSLLMHSDVSLAQYSRLKSSMPFKHDLALQNTPLSKQSFNTQPQIENEDIT